MAQIRIKGPAIGDNLGAVSATVGSQTVSATVARFIDPAAQATVPTISDAFDDGTLTPDDNGIAVSTRIWRIVGGAVQGNGATLSGSGLGGEWIEYSPDNGTTWSPPVQVYSTTMMGMAMPVSHIADDAAILSIVPHGRATHIAVTDGDWTSPATWLGGALPRNGARVLIPNGIAVTYDSTEANVRLDWLRVDGRLWVDTATLTNAHLEMLVETIVVTRGGDMEIGTSTNRMPAAASMNIIFSGRDYQTKAYADSDLVWARDNAEDTKLWSRGAIFQGRISVWGNEGSMWHYAEPISVGATSLTLREDPTGWAIGDEIIIGGTGCSLSTTNASNDTFNKQDETRTITDISGPVISWTGALSHPHDNQLTGSTRTDLYPVVMRKGGKNVIFRSEVTDDIPRRGHVASVHHMSTTDIWDAAFIGLGRVDKSEMVGTLVNSDVDFMFKKPSGAGRSTTSKDARSNVFGRYSFHCHHVGYNHTGARPQLVNCYGEGSPGWMFVHHACDADFINCTGTDFLGAFMVSEQGSELGTWSSCLAMGTTLGVRSVPAGGNTEAGFTGINTLAKNLEGFRGVAGDTFSYGIGFANRGRGVRNNGSVAVSCTHGFTYFHRTSANNVQDSENIPRAFSPLKTAGYFTGTLSAPRDESVFVDFPIIGLADVTAIGCHIGMFVSKEGPGHGHDVNVHLKRLKFWGCENGAAIEYVGAYLVDDSDFVALNAGSGTGLSFVTNSFQMGANRVNTEGWNLGVQGVSSTAGNNAGDEDNFNNTTNPRYYNFGHSSSDDSTASQMHTGKFIENADWDNTAVDIDADPTENLPLEVGIWNGGNFVNSAPTNASGTKSDNLSSGNDVVRKGFATDATTFTTSDGFALQDWASTYGHWSYGGDTIVVFPWIISDRLTARPARIGKMIRSTESGGATPGTDNGAYSYSATPATANDITQAVALNTATTVNVVTAASPAGAGSGSFSLDSLDHLPPDHGRVSFSGNELTYTPDTGFAGSDEMFCFVVKNGQYATVRVSFLVGGSGGGLTTPIVDTHFAVSDASEENTIDLALLDPPDTDGRRILYTQYSTDAGVTWRRVCNQWRKAVHKINVASDGTAITNGAYSIRIRYFTDYDFGFSAASADDAATVT